MIVPESTFYLLVSTVALVATVGFVARLRQFSGTTRQYLLLAPFVSGMLMVGYFAMANQLLVLHSPGGEPVPVSRFTMYLFTYPLVVASVGVLADASRRLTVAGMIALVGFVSGTLVNWLAPVPFDSGGKLMVLASIASALYLLFVPYTRSAQSVTGARRLLFGKLRNLMALLMLMYLVVGLTSRQGLGLLGTFTGVYVGGYLDLLGHIGFGGILLRAPTAVRELAAEHPTPLDYFRDDGTQPPSTDAPAGD
jgi:sensory rhodopsin